MSPNKNNHMLLDYGSIEDSIVERLLYKFPYYGCKSYQTESININLLFILQPELLSNPHSHINIIQPIIQFNPNLPNEQSD